MTLLPHPEEEDEAERIAAWLAARPSFLAERPLLYRHLAPPRRVHGERLADHMAAMLAAERHALRDTARAARSGDSLATRVQGAVLALIGTQDPAETIALEWPTLLGLDSVALAAEGLPRRHLRPLRPGMLDRLLPPGRHLLLRDRAAGCLPDDIILHGETAPLVSRDALLRLPGTGLLALGTREPALLPLQGSGRALDFLARAAAAALLATKEGVAAG
ncbi:hypothetical protein MVG78_00930 [Roseomonas gilardii subsp. gilardii]|uniref:hypothetical protein n=1 Tax=Roseomonas gilardii TaxID=257708 RepID=UPI001FF9FA98|nr:hypothetical protein [Roseomonas gilardii]UPG72799.1 hypothetical protein MVG78_00930 [Roseomonas gilardii subsp. gilardii]